MSIRSIAVFMGSQFGVQSEFKTVATTLGQPWLTKKLRWYTAVAGMA